MSFLELSDLRRHYAGQAGQLVRDFYVPVLSRAVRYDRQAGFFDSASLVQLASGLAGFVRRQRTFHGNRLVPGQPPMRLVTGATWSLEDIAAYQRGIDALGESLGQSLLRHFEPSDEECLRLGLPPGWRPEEDEIARHRLGALAWMAATGLLEVCIALPLDCSGRPYKVGRHGALYHPKAGVLYDEEGHAISFQGSVNETGAAWTRNREKFEVKRSWHSTQDAEDIQHEAGEFEAIWGGKDPGLLVLPLPKAVQEYMDGFVPLVGPPEYDPLEVGQGARSYTPLERIQAQWLLDAPKKPGGERLVHDPLWADGKPFNPFPHQERVYQRALEAFPRSFMFCDEVGLGKTIEAGLLLRSLTIKGRLGRVLLITPRGLVRQWMEELREKFALTAWFFDGAVLCDVGGRARQTSHPWDEDGIVLVSRHLVVRRDRRDQWLSPSRPWDVVVVDEAHAARRLIMRDTDEPNLALQFLTGLHDRRLAGCFWLLTATPMQLDPHEAHDLLMLCGLEDRSWGAWSGLEAFNEYFEQLRRFGGDQSVRAHVVKMARMAVHHGAPDFEPANVPPPWSPHQWQTFVPAVQSSSAGLLLTLQGMKGGQAEAITPHLSRQTPLGVHMFRYTRSTLRAYQERDLVQSLARRQPEDVPVDFQSEKEGDLYGRIDTLCADFYRLADVAPEERSGIGFLKAVFRKRLSSSFAAFRCSLERRKALIESIQNELDEGAAKHALIQEAEEEDEDDDEGSDASALVDRERARLARMSQSPERRERVEAERAFLQSYITDLGQVGSDSKFETFKEKLREVVAAGRRVIVFTQYLDTLDFIRDGLVGGFGSKIACYSGRGGEVWDAAANTWRRVEKAEVKARSRQDHVQPIRILLGTDAASEGLNLQEFSALFNYDLPWNPMRVEQRIGRIDRIGQEAETVTILNLYVRDTIEEDTYLTLKDRIHLFEDVVGPLQPILAEMPRILRKVALGEMERAEARRMIDDVARQRPQSAFSELERFAMASGGPGGATVQGPPATQGELAAWCLSHPAPGMRVTTVPEPGSEVIERDGTQACLAILWTCPPLQLGADPTEEILATFSGEMADRHPPTAQQDEGLERVPGGREGVRLLTWGDPLLDAWLDAVRGDPLLPSDYEAAGISEGTDPFSLE